MIKRFWPLLISLLILPFWLCSWVDQSSSDTFEGTIIFNSVDNNVNVTHLSGSGKFILNDYSTLCNTSSSFLYNYGSSGLVGTMNLNGTDYPIRFQSQSELQVQQSYTQNGQQRTTWVNYHLRADKLPSDLSVSEIALISVSITIVLCAGFVLLVKGVIA